MNKVYYLQRQYIWPFWVRYGDDFDTWEKADRARRVWVDLANWRMRNKIRVRVKQTKPRCQH